MNYIALFDWDKTVRKNYACLMWLEMLEESGKIKKGLVKENGEVYQRYLKGELDHNELTEEGMKVYGKYIQGVRKEEILPVLEAYKKRDEGNIFKIMKQDIFPFLKRNKIKIIVISGAQQELIELYKEELGIDEIYGVQYAIENGIYTNQYQNNGSDKNKEIMVKEICKDKENKILFSFGDSISDIPLLKAAKKSFINNTNIKFLEQENARYYDFHQEEDGKRIIQEMKNIVREYNTYKA